MTSTSIKIEKERIPDEFIERCINGHIGGVMLVFVTGKDLVEREKKINEIKDFVKTMQIKYDTVPKEKTTV